MKEITKFERLQTAIENLGKREITRESIIEWEIESIKNAVGCELPLDDNTLENNCSEDLREILKPLDESDRNFLAPDYITGGNEVNIFGDDGDIIYMTGEVEYQFDPSTEYFEDPSDFHINGDLAYISCTGISLKVDLEGLKKAIKDWVS